MMQKCLREGLVVATPTKPFLEVVGAQAVDGVGTPSSGSNASSSSSLSHSNPT
jgi:hypothetical protein